LRPPQKVSASELRGRGSVGYLKAKRQVKTSDSDRDIAVCALDPSRTSSFGQGEAVEFLNQGDA